MKICITLDDVIRAKTKQIAKMYKKYINKDLDLDNVDLSSENLCEALGFESQRDYKEFLYQDYSYEIFGEAGLTEKQVDKKLNLWQLYLNENKPNVELMLANPYEFNFSLGYTCFFLSKLAPRIREFYFPANSLEIWEKCDVLVTACPNLIENKPEGKKVIKIETEYNEKCQADFTFGSLTEMFEDKEIIKKIEEKND